jgi:hypothetical protein
MTVMFVVCPKCNSTHEVDTSNRGWSDTCIECTPKPKTYVPSPLPMLELMFRVCIRLVLRVYYVFDFIVLMFLLGFARILNLLGLIRFGWIVLHWWRGDRR